MKTDPTQAINKAARLRAHGDLAGALRTLRQARKSHPSHVPLLHALGLELDRQGQHQKAVQTLQQARAGAPQAADIINDLGNALQASRKRPEALAAYSDAARFAPHIAGVRANIGHIQQMMGDNAAAKLEFEAALALDAQYLAAHYQLAVIALASGLHETALDHLNACQSIDSYHPEALSLRAVVLAGLGRTEEARQLVDYERFIVKTHIEPPPGFNSLRDFNRALENYILDKPLIPDPYLVSTRGGHHGDDIIWDAKGPAAGLRTRLREAFGAYLRALPQAPGHPFLAANPTRVKLIAQANVLASAGYLTDHVHPQAWVSGAYYVRLPREIGNAQSKAGWLRFGALPDNITAEPPFEIIHIEPQEGRLVLFPAYFYHGTVPWRGKKHRMSLGIDVIAQ